MDIADLINENLKAFRAQKMITKEDVLQGIEKMKAECWTLNGKRSDKERAYVEAGIREVERFRKAIERHVIFDAPEDWWAYSIEMRSSDICLYLEHFNPVFSVSGTPIMDVENNEKYCLITVKTKLLTVEEYARLHGIEHVTAVARIRRGKLRSAVKFGKEWRIPLLSPPIRQGYTPATYKWDSYLSRLPAKFELFNEYNRADFFQDQEEPGKYHVRFSGEDIETIDIVCDREQKGAIEQQLIAHPDVFCESEVIYKI